ncbi:hypothetical protein [Agrobacterium tumefaciens]|uniref:hypothetical protein n=1 Tax=Agrobacterium tumefaciens TaxID=358 RepID=UPI0015726423|nr:hypothetical protein [Agrobacterium tumefaciens]
MTKIDHERAIFRLRDSTSSEPHWNGFVREKPKRHKPQPNPKTEAEKLRYMELCARSIEAGHNFPRIPPLLKRAILVNKKMDKNRLIWAWLSRHDEFEEIHARIRGKAKKQKNRSLQQSCMSR